MKKIFTLLSFCTIFLTVQAQDARFSQINASPLQLNPAMIGVYQGQYRLVANYRELYASILQDNPFRTVAASFDIRYPVNRGDYFGLGISALRDEVGLANFNRTRANVGGSFLKELSGGRYGKGSQYLVAGAQVGIGQRGFDWGNLWFSQQFDPESYSVDFNAASGESIPTMTQVNTGIHLDVNAGLLWYILMDENTSFYAGGSVHHINTPNISFLGDAEENLDRRFVGHLGGQLPISRGDNLSILPAAAFMSQGPAMSTTAGANFRYTDGSWDALALRVGGWMHFSNKLESEFLMDAFIVNAVLETERWMLGLSYDITTSSLTNANNGRGAFEISLTYIHPEKKRNRLECPTY